MSGCAHGPNQCTEWPEPDKLGRYRCVVCRCFTARHTLTGWRHSWCDRKVDR